AADDETGDEDAVRLRRRDACAGRKIDQPVRAKRRITHTGEVLPLTVGEEDRAGNGRVRRVDIADDCDVPGRFDLERSVGCHLALGADDGGGGDDEDVNVAIR